MTDSVQHPSAIATLSPGPILAVSMPAIAIMYGIGRYAYGLFLPAFQAQFGFSLEYAGYLSSMATAVYAALAMLSVAVVCRFRPIYFIVLAGVCTTAGILIVAKAQDTAAFTIGTVLASCGAGIAPPAYLEIIGRWLQAPVRNRSTVLLNTSGAPGLAFGAICAHFFATDWRMTWIVFAAGSAIVTLLNVAVIPWRAIERAPRLKTRRKMTRSLLPEGWRTLCSISFFYGFVINIYYTYSVSKIVGVASDPGLRLVFWTIIGLSGLVAAMTNSIVLRIGVFRTIAISFLVLALALYGLTFGSVAILLGSGVLFGIFSIVPNSACLVLSNALYSDRLSLGWGVVFLLLSVGMSVGATFAGVVAGAYDFNTMFEVTACLSLCAAVIIALQRPVVPSGLEAHDKDGG